MGQEGSSASCINIRYFHGFYFPSPQFLHNFKNFIVDPEFERLC